MSTVNEPEVEIVEIFVIVIDLEERAKSGEPHPHREHHHVHHYRIKIDKDYYVVEVSQMTGREILKLAKKEPVDRWMLKQRFHDGKVITIGYDDVVDFTTHGIERFTTLPLDQTEG